MPPQVVRGKKASKCVDGLEPTFAPPAATSIYHIDVAMLLRPGKTCPTRPCRQSRRSRRYRHALISLNYLDTSTRCSALWRRMTGMLVPGLVRRIGERAELHQPAFVPPVPVQHSQHSEAPSRVRSQAPLLARCQPGIGLSESRCNSPPHDQI